MSANFKSQQPLILAVDNALMFLSTLERILEQEPYELRCVTTADAALEFLAGNQPDLILIDVEMPDMDGYELTGIIKRNKSSIPILIVTANHDKEYYDRAIKAGASDLLIKPLRRAQLLEKLKEYT